MYVLTFDRLLEELKLPCGMALSFLIPRLKEVATAVGGRTEEVSGWV